MDGHSYFIHLMTQMMEPTHAITWVSTTNELA